MKKPEVEIINITEDLLYTSGDECSPDCGSVGNSCDSECTFCENDGDCPWY